MGTILEFFHMQFVSSLLLSPVIPNNIIVWCCCLICPVAAEHWCCHCQNCYMWSLQISFLLIVPVIMVPAVKLMEKFVFQLLLFIREVPVIVPIVIRHSIIITFMISIIISMIISIIILVFNVALFLLAIAIVIVIANVIAIITTASCSHAIILFLYNSCDWNYSNLNAFFATKIKTVVTSTWILTTIGISDSLF